MMDNPICRSARLPRDGRVFRIERLAAVVLLASIAACTKSETPESAGAKWGEPLDTAAIQAALSGATEKFDIVDRGKPLSGTQTYSPDGTATGTYLWNNKDAGTYTVQWSAKNDMYCSVTVTRDSKPMHDPESCLKVYFKDGTYYFLNPDDRLHGLSTITR
jgi:hypothetical protein